MATLPRVPRSYKRREIPVDFSACRGDFPTIHFAAQPDVGYERPVLACYSLEKGDRLFAGLSIGFQIPLRCLFTNGCLKLRQQLRSQLSSEKLLLSNVPAERQGMIDDITFGEHRK